MDRFLNKYKENIKSSINKLKKYIPNILTTLRLLAVPVFFANFLNNNLLISTIIFGGACITDAFDGFLARRWHVESNYGKIVDPLADKLIVLSSLILYASRYNILMSIPIVLESLIAAVNIIYCLKNLDYSLLKNLKIKDKINYIIKNGKVDVYEIGRKKTVVLMITATLSVINTNINNILEPLINTLLLITSSLEICTLSTYTYNKIIANDNNDNDIKNDDVHTPIEKDKEEKNIKEKSNKKEMYKKLKQELTFLEEEKKKKEKINLKRLK